MINWSDLAFILVLTISFISLIFKYYYYNDEYLYFAVDELKSAFFEAVVSNTIKWVFSWWFLPCIKELFLLFLILVILLDLIVDIAIVISENRKLKKIVKLLTWIKKILEFLKSIFLDSFLSSVIPDEVLALLCKDIIEKDLWDKILHENRED